MHRRDDAGAFPHRQKLRQAAGRIVQKPGVLGNGDRARRHWQYPDPVEYVLIHTFRSWPAVSPVTIEKKGKRLAPVIIHRTDGDVTAVDIRQLLKFILILFC